MFIYAHDSFRILKQNVRILGIDDGPFLRGRDDRTPLVGVLMRMDFVIEAVLVDSVPIDGNGTLRAIETFTNRIGGQNIHAILAEGITFAGFDIVNPEEIHDRTGIPFISITRGKGDLDSMVSALEAHGDENKIRVLRALRPEKVTIGKTPFILNMSGLPRGEALTIVQKLMRVGNVPEPVRIADMIASAIAKGENSLP